MGKRELFIVIAFVAIGAIAYQVTAPSPKAGERSFSLSRIFSNIRNEIRSNNASASLTKKGTIELRHGVTEIRFTAIRSMPLTITGENRKDIGYELSIVSNGPDESTAGAWAEKVKMTDDDLGAAQSIGVWFPKEGDQKGALTLRVPEHLLTRVEGSGRASVSDVRAVELRNMAGEVTLTNIKGMVTGSHRAADLTITGAAGITLALASSRAKFSQVKGPMSINARSGNCSIADSKGSLEITATQVDLTITEHDGEVKVTGENGMLRLVRPTGEVAVDIRRAPVEVTLAAAAPATIITTDEDLRLTLVGPPAVLIDALVNEDGIVRAPELGLDPAAAKESKLSKPVGGGGPRVVLRNTRADIVIAVRK